MSTGNSLAMLPWFPADFLSATRGWSVTAKGVYRELLDAQWELGVLPADPEELRGLIGATEAEWAQGWARCNRKFVAVEGGLHNVRLEEHRSKAARLKAARVASAERTNAQRRGDRDGDRDGDRTADRRGDRDGDRDGDRTADRRGDRDGDRSHPTVTVPLTATVTATSPSPSPSPSPSRSSDSGVLEDSDSRPHERTSDFHQLVIGAYHELLPELPRVKVWTKKRRQALEARIRERCKDGKPADTLEYWRKLFQTVAASDFLCGRAAPRDGREPFHADLEWLIRPENFAKVIEGRYDGRRVNGADHAR